MNIISIDKKLNVSKPVVATIGFYDGVHRGHRYLIDRLRQLVTERNGYSMVVTFDNHPRQILQSSFSPLLLTTLEDKLNLLSQTGVDYCAVLPFSREMSRLTACEFMEKILKDKLSVSTLLTGYDNRFGCQRSEGFDDYLKYGAEMGIEVVANDAFLAEENKVSSSLIRQCLADGDVQSAKAYLGRCYSVVGKVVEGDRIGHTLGFPTANIDLDGNDIILPQRGVYAVKVDLAGSTSISSSLSKLSDGMMNIGYRPTFGGKTRTLEINIFNVNKDLYNQRLRVFFVKKLRDEQHFANGRELAKQLCIDKEHALSVLGSMEIKF